MLEKTLSSKNTPTYILLVHSALLISIKKNAKRYSLTPPSSQHKINKSGKTENQKRFLFKYFRRSWILVFMKWSRSLCWHLFSLLLKPKLSAKNKHLKCSKQTYFSTQYSPQPPSCNWMQTCWFCQPFKHNLQPIKQIIVKPLH